MTRFSTPTLYLNSPACLFDLFITVLDILFWWILETEDAR